jgi:hypothetical protein
MSSHLLALDRYGPAVRPLLQDLTACELGPGSPRDTLRSQLSALTPQALAHGASIVDSRMAQCCLSGLWLLHNFLGESHSISQDIETGSGSYWHAIMHRREPDFSNARYWFRRLGRHAVFTSLADEARKLPLANDVDDAGRAVLAAETWDALAFVDLCQKAWRHQQSATADLCRQISWIEWQLLFDHCYRSAFETP